MDGATSSYSVCRKARRSIEPEGCWWRDQSAREHPKIMHHVEMIGGVSELFPRVRGLPWTTILTHSLTTGNLVVV